MAIHWRRSLVFTSTVFSVANFTPTGPDTSERRGLTGSHDKSVSLFDICIRRRVGNYAPGTFPRYQASHFMGDLFRKGCEFSLDKLLSVGCRSALLLVLHHLRSTYWLNFSGRDGKSYGRQQLHPPLDIVIYKSYITPRICNFLMVQVKKLRYTFLIGYF